MDSNFQFRFDARAAYGDDRRLRLQAAVARRRTLPKAGQGEVSELKP
jgi:hypothetical protein